MSNTNHQDICYQYHSRSCSACSATNRIQVHHIDGDAANDSQSNLVPLCMGCHQLVEKHCWTDEVGDAIDTDNPVLVWLIRKKRVHSPNTEASARRGSSDSDNIRFTLRMYAELVAQVDKVQEEYALPSRNAAINFIVKQGVKDL